MATKSTKLTKPNKEAPESLAIAEHGINTGRDFANCMSALMSDLLAGRLSPIVGNAVLTIREWRESGSLHLCSQECAHKLLDNPSAMRAGSC